MYVKASEGNTTWNLQNEFWPISSKHIKCCSHLTVQTSEVQIQLFLLSLYICRDRLKHNIDSISHYYYDLRPKTNDRCTDSIVRFVPIVYRLGVYWLYWPNLLIIVSITWLLDYISCCVQLWDEFCTNFLLRIQYYFHFFRVSFANLLFIMQ